MQRVQQGAYPDIIALIVACTHCGQRSGSSAFACRRLRLLLSYFTPSAALGSGGKWDVEGMKRVRERARELQVNMDVMYVCTSYIACVCVFVHARACMCVCVCI